MKKIYVKPTVIPYSVVKSSLLSGSGESPVSGGDGTDGDHADAKQFFFDIEIE